MIVFVLVEPISFVDNANIHIRAVPQRRQHLSITTSPLIGVRASVARIEDEIVSPGRVKLLLKLISWELRLDNVWHGNDSVCIYMLPVIITFIADRVEVNSTELLREDCETDAATDSRICCWS